MPGIHMNNRFIHCLLLLTCTVVGFDLQMIAQSGEGLQVASEAHYQWVFMSNRDPLPANRIGLSLDSERHYFQSICRVNIHGGLHPGKLLPDQKTCNVSWGGAGTFYTKFEILVGDRQGSWDAQAEHGGPLDFASALIGGHEENGNAIYVCAAEHSTPGSGEVQIGKYVAGACNIEYGGSELALHTNVKLYYVPDGTVIKTAFNAESPEDRALCSAGDPDACRRVSDDLTSTPDDPKDIEGSIAHSKRASCYLQRAGRLRVVAGECAANPGSQGCLFDKNVVTTGWLTAAACDAGIQMPRPVIKPLPVNQRVIISTSPNAGPYLGGGRPGFERGYYTTMYCGNQPESWVRGSASLDTHSGLLTMQMQLETDSTVAGPKGTLDVYIKDSEGKVLDTVSVDEVSIGGKPPGGALIKSISTTKNIPLADAGYAMSIDASAKCTGSATKIWNISQDDVIMAVKLVSAAVKAANGDP